MIAAEEWRKYQESYINYGVDLSPKLPRETKRKKEKTSLKVTAQEKVMILMFIAAVGVCCIAILLIQACASDINYNVYALNQSINTIEDEIDNLNVTLQSQNNLSQIEDYAANNLKMIYPDKGQRVSVDDLVGSAEVDDYIASLSESQKGMAVSKHATVVTAAKHLLSQA
jgi:cell division protein FtsL